MAEWLKGLAKPVGLLADTDERGQQVLEVCQVTGIKVPEEVAVLGVGNDDFICEFTCPPMSSIRVNVETVGFQMAEFFARLLNGENLPPQTFVSRPIAVTERQSTDVLAVDDDVVKEAVQFIRQNSMRPLGVLDAAEAVSVTVRTLDRRFKKALGRSVYNEIARVRIEQVCRMLLESSLSIFDIAHKMGYSDPVDLNRAFKREKGIAPSAYRMAHTAI